MLLFFLEIIYPRIPGALAPQDFLNTALPEDVLSLYAKYLVNLSIWTGGILALAGLIYGGILYLISTGKPDRMILAKNQISAAFFGLLILLSSYLILETLSPQFINLKIPTLQQIQIPVKPDVPLPEITAINSSIDVEMPFARIIEKIFETYISDYPKPEDKKTPRMTRIKDIAKSTKEITDNLLNQSKDLESSTNSCQCKQTRACCEIPNPGPGCTDNACYSKSGTTSDPCKSVRGEIQTAEDKNKEEINNLGIKNTEIEQEVRLLKEELDRLKRAEKFIKECPLRSLTSLIQFYNKKSSYDNQGWTLGNINFWDDVNLYYYTGEYTKNPDGRWYFQPTKEFLPDFATFYCSVSGTMEQEEVFPVFAPDEDKLTGEESIEDAEEVFSESMACSNEAPVGEIIDRTKRTTQLLIDKLELLVEKNKELTDAIDYLQVLISQCSSQRCFSFCVEVKGKCVIKRAQDSPQYPEGPCPKTDIKKQRDKIQDIWTEIKNIIEGREDKNTPETIGIITIIDEISPEIIKDLAKNVRYTMRHYDELFNCSQAKGAIIPPQNAVLRKCCQTENWDQEKQKMVETIYGDCFGECYLEIGQKKHRKCVQECLNKKAQELNDPEIAKCIHELNFYVCEIK